MCGLDGRRRTRRRRYGPSATRWSSPASSSLATSTACSSASRSRRPTSAARSPSPRGCRPRGTSADLRQLHDELSKKAGAVKAAIFKAYLEFLEDPDLVAAAHDQVGAGHSAGWAWRKVYEERAEGLARLDDPLLAARAADLRDVGRRVLRLLADAIESAASLPSHPVVLLADDLSPSDTAKLDPKQVLGLCTAVGGATSHTAIIARSLDITAVVAAGPAALDVEDGQACILDGDAGVLVVRPTARDSARAEVRRGQVLERREAERLDRYKPSITRDGRRVEVVANTGAPGEAQQAVDAGGEGVGLMRTEFLFLKRESPPSEDEQAEAYTTMVRALNGLPTILRTLDSAVTGALSMGLGCGLRAPHGGVFVLAIPNAVSPLGVYLLSIVAGTVVTALALMVLKRPVAQPVAPPPARP
ncbi:putative PEP-binding protein [Sorangium sp. So ce429]